MARETVQCEELLGADRVLIFDLVMRGDFFLIKEGFLQIEMAEIRI
jgi:hypothetical protein